MKIWHALFNLFAVVMIAMMLVIFNGTMKANMTQFEEQRLSYAVNYAVDAAFYSAVNTDDIGTDYAYNGLQEVHINPANVLKVFDSIMCLNYDIALTDNNFDKIEQSIITGTLACLDGYYILEEYEVDNNPYDNVVGGDYKMLWGLKRPYTMYLDKSYNDDNANALLTMNLVNQKCSQYMPNGWTNEEGEVVYVRSYATYDELRTGTGSGSSDERIEAQKKVAIAKLIQDDLNGAIRNKNIYRNGNFISNIMLAPDKSLQYINSIKSPSLLILYEDNAFLSGYHIQANSLGGATVRPKVKVIGFTKNGVKYYCYAGQQTEANGQPLAGISQQKEFNSAHEAAMKGYYPYFEYLEKKY